MWCVHFSHKPLLEWGVLWSQKELTIPPPFLCCMFLYYQPFELGGSCFWKHQRPRRLLCTLFIWFICPVVPCFLCFPLTPTTQRFNQLCPFSPMATGGFGLCSVKERGVARRGRAEHFGSTGVLLGVSMTLHKCAQCLQLPTSFSI